MAFRAVAGMLDLGLSTVVSRERFKTTSTLGSNKILLVDWSDTIERWPVG